MVLRQKKQFLEETWIGRTSTECSLVCPCRMSFFMRNITTVIVLNWLIQH